MNDDDVGEEQTEPEVGIFINLMKWSKQHILEWCNSEYDAFKITCNITDDLKSKKCLSILEDNNDSCPSLSSEGR